MPQISEETRCSTLSHFPLTQVRQQWCMIILNRSKSITGTFAEQIFTWSKEHKKSGSHIYLWLLLPALQQKIEPQKSVANYITWKSEHN